MVRATCSPTHDRLIDMTTSHKETQPSNDGPFAHYEALIAAGDLQPDEAQADVVAHLQTLHDAISAACSTAPQSDNPGFLSRLRSTILGSSAEQQAKLPDLRGLYIHGPVGRGKSLVMDLFYDTAPAAKKRRLHFHAFMQDIHARLTALRTQAGSDGVNDAIVILADRLFDEATLLCFDEFHVQNIADAMILGRLFDRLFDLGLVMVATSNFPPDRLYERGLNRDRFLPFIDRLNDELDVVSLAGPTDYRLERLQNLPVYYCPDGPEARGALERIFSLLTDEAEGDVDELEVASRRLIVPKAARGVAWFNFQELCEQPLGAADYLALADRYHTIIVESVPLLTRHMHNEARRFMTLVDALYECKVNLIVSADAEPMALYQAGEGAFEFERTASRLMEMRSRDYIETPPSTVAATDFVPFALTTDLV